MSTSFPSITPAAPTAKSQNELWHGPLCFTRLPICWVTKFYDRYASGVVADAHIVDQCLASQHDDPASVLHSPDNRIKLACHLHAAFDRRLISFDPETGRIVSQLSPDELHLLGISPEASLDPMVLTEERRRWLRLRENDWDAFRFSKACLTADKKSSSPPAS